jgi:ribosomal protein S27AE
VVAIVCLTLAAVTSVVVGILAIAFDISDLLTDGLLGWSAGLAVVALVLGLYVNPILDARRRPPGGKPISQWRESLVELTWTAPAIAVAGFLLQIMICAWAWWRGQACPFAAQFVDGLILLGVFIAVAFVSTYVIRRRFWAMVRRERLCGHCGYDMRGHGDDALCPECGKTPFEA